LTARILSGSDVAKAVRDKVKSDVEDLNARGISVGLATVLVGDDPASHSYVRYKHKDAESVGIVSVDVKLPSDVSQDDVFAAVDDLNARDDVTGMIVQLPLPSPLDGEAAVERVLPTKDADGLHPFNLGRLILSRPAPLPATPSGIMTILDHYGFDVAGMTAVVVGRSFLVGRPMALMLGAKGVDATVIQAHSRTPNLAAVTSKADLLVTAIGRPGMIDASFVKPGAIVIDVGTNRTEAGLVGDVAFEEVLEVAGAITPVPGGVGPMTRASLLVNTVGLAVAQHTS
jgi:methylenetetrahydrofolate dehydrogenase (NADP+)/methenyltetrahydrofolate cyclohydrolase